MADIYVFLLGILDDDYNPEYTIQVMGGARTPVVNIPVKGSLSESHAHAVALADKIGATFDDRTEGALRA